jgi:hypothetical protein
MLAELSYTGHLKTATGKTGSSQNGAVPRLPTAALLEVVTPFHRQPTFYNAGSVELLQQPEVWEYLETPKRMALCNCYL